MNKATMSAVAVVSALAFAPAMAQVGNTPGAQTPSTTQQQQNMNTQTPGANVQTPNQTPGAAGQMNPSGQRMTEAQVRTHLQSQGYTQIDRIELRGSEYEIQARRGNQNFRLQVDATTGQVKSSTPAG